MQLDSRTLAQLENAVEDNEERFQSITITRTQFGYQAVNNADGILPEGSYLIFAGSLKDCEVLGY